ncbi:MAG: TatD family hydrolase [Spirochaetes bacterium]|jgi:TatD DNase family protein|nr:TatD family hydrolase [Spirochaetota bacterium]
MYIDSHAHFDILIGETGADEKEVMDGLKKNGVSRAVQVSIDAGGLGWSREFAGRHSGSGILFTAGIHPSSRADGEQLGALEKFVLEVSGSPDSKLLFGIGECGLDYYRMRMPVEMQRSSFERQIDLAARHSLPLIVHTREAMEDTISILRKKPHSPVIIHCFPGDRKAASLLLDMGCMLSFAGNLTYRTAEALQDSARFAPLDRMLVETDAPFLAPVPMRGKKNRPEFVAHTYRFISELKRENLSKIIDSVRENFDRLIK